MKKLNLILLFFLLISTVAVNAQELFCEVRVQTGPNIQETDRQVYLTMENSIKEFINNRKWTDDNVLPNERIQCNIVINITDRPATDEFKATVQVQATRPVYGTNYSTPIFRVIDRNFNFKYAQFQSLELADGSYSSNLTSLLGFYVYVVLGLDYDSFKELGGAPHFTKAMLVLNAAQIATGDEGKGWKASDSDRNRYWLINQLQDSRYQNFRKSWYTYHRQAMDNFATRPEHSRGQILTFLQQIHPLHKSNPTSYLLTIFFDTKADELANVFSQGSPNEKSSALSILREVDINNVKIYEEKLR
jgi:hypothetical protein